MTGNSTTPHGYGLWVFASSSQVSPSPLVIAARFAPSPITEVNPRGPAIGSAGPVTPASANNAADSPPRAEAPTPMLLAMVPSVSTSPDDCAEALPIAQTMRSASNRSTFAAAAAAPNTPQVDVMCQPRW